jgi:molybdopterin biosynthesis enzyme
MSDRWIDRRLVDKVGKDEADIIKRTMQSGDIERWKIQVKPDGSTGISKINEKGYVIRGIAGKVE